MSKTITSYKGFDAEMKCRGMQYEIGKTYTHKGDVKACESGLHACEYPLDVLQYYPPSTSQFAVAEQSGEIAKHTDDSKIASSVLHVEASIDLAGMVKAAIDYTFARSKPEGETATGVRGAASATRWSGAASATGVRGAASATGARGAASATGDNGAASATGVRGAASATGWSGAASATGVRGAASATGERGAASATGWSGAASATGEYGAASVTGVRGAASATGWNGAASATGVRGAASATGYGGKVKGSKGNALFLVERDDEYNIIAVGAAIVGKKGIKADTWYTLVKGKFVEV